MTTFTPNRFCFEHQGVAAHTTLNSIGVTCLPCLNSYFAIHERFAAWARAKTPEPQAPPAVCEVCNCDWKPAKLVVQPASEELAECAYVLCQDCTTTAAWTISQ